MITQESIVNSMLAVIGEGGVSTLNTLHPSVQTAKRILEEQDIEFQSLTWWFNTERGVTLAQDNAGRVEMPADTLSFQITNVSNNSPVEKTRYTRRGKYVYDTILHTNEINCSIVADLVIRVDVADMPPVASAYLRAVCCWKMYLDDDGDQLKLEKLERVQGQKWQALQAEKMRILAVNALDTPAARILRSGYLNGGVMFGIDGGGTR